MTIVETGDDIEFAPISSLPRVSEVLEHPAEAGLGASDEVELIKDVTTEIRTTKDWRVAKDQFERLVVRTRMLVLVSWHP